MKAEAEPDGSFSLKFEADETDEVGEMLEVDLSVAGLKGRFLFIRSFDEHGVCTGYEFIKTDSSAERSNVISVETRRTA